MGCHRPSLDAIRAMEPGQRLAALATLSRDADEGRKLRDQTMRELRASGRHTIAQIAEMAGVSLATAKIVLRGQQ